MSNPPSPYRRRRGPAVDEEALVHRYTRDQWSIAACAARFGIGEGVARSILVRHNVQLRPPASAAKAGPAAAVKRGKPEGPRRGHMFGPEGQAQIKRSFRLGPPAEPSRSDLLRVGQAARMLNVDPAVLRTAAAAGQIRVIRAPNGWRQYIRADLLDLGQRLGLIADKGVS